MKVAVTGATGTIGRVLVGELTGRGDEVTALSRDGARASSSLGVEGATWAEPEHERPPADALRGRDAVVNLIGEPLDQRWTDDAKRAIRESRVGATRNLVAGLGELPEADRPRVLVSQSASGRYGAHGSERLDETAPAGDDFLATMVVDWEAEALRAEELGLRVAVTRTGVVLAPAGGALKSMLPFFRLGLGGPVAGGSQYFPWVHVDDVAGAIAFCLDTDAASGALNVAAPEPVTNKEFSSALGRVLRRPAVMPVPAFALKLLYGEMGTVVITGQRMIPARLTELGYGFRHPELEEALRAAIG